MALQITAIGKRLMTWRNIRISILLFILATVAQQSLLNDGAPNWDKTLYVTLYPINADGSEASARIISQLDNTQFEGIETYMSEESGQYHLPLAKPFAVRLGSEVKKIPPKPEFGALNTIIWSLRFRWWASQNSPKTNVPGDIRLYILYHDPATNPVLKHSVALYKGRIGIVNVFADNAYGKQNNVIIGHELLHTVGATDKYDLNTNQPAYPIGFAEPNKEPLYPQSYAELMAGRIPLSETEAKIPFSLGQTLVGDLTAKEIGWAK